MNMGVKAYNVIILIADVFVLLTTWMYFTFESILRKIIPAPEVDVTGAIVLVSLPVIELCYADFQYYRRSVLSSTKLLSINKQISVSVSNFVVIIFNAKSHITIEVAA